MILVCPLPMFWLQTTDKTIHMSCVKSVDTKEEDETKGYFLGYGVQFSVQDCVSQNLQRTKQSMD